MQQAGCQPLTQAIYSGQLTSGNYLIAIALKQLQDEKDKLQATIASGQLFPSVIRRT
jgi:hypothetical protein